MAYARVLAILPLVAVSLAIPEAFAATNERSIGKQEAQKSADTAYKKFSSGFVDRFRCYLVEESRNKWVFVCKDLDPTPPPGADSMVTVQKKSGRTVVTPGR